VSALKTVYDPEIPADIYELGLIYKIDIEDDRSVKIDMTLTAPGCPVAGEMPGWVENAVGAVEGVSGVDVKMVFDPPDRMDARPHVRKRRRSRSAGTRQIFEKKFSVFDRLFNRNQLFPLGTFHGLALRRPSKAYK
jgi:FeS assembly SUF system protein